MKACGNIRFYRVTQVMEKLMNHVWRKPLMPVLLMAIIIAETTALYVLTTSSSKLPVAILGCFTMIGADFVGVIHVIYRILGLPYLSSKKLIGNVKLCQKGGNSAWFKRYLKSCPPLKIGMGDGTFFDRLTPIVIWQFCVDRLISMLLVQIDLYLLADICMSCIVSYFIITRIYVKQFEV